MNEQGHYRSFQRRVFAVNHLQLLTIQNNQETEHVQNTNQCNPQNGPKKQQYKTLQKPRLRERGQTEPGLVAFYVIRSGNGAGLYSYNPGARTGQ